MVMSLFENCELCSCSERLLTSGRTSSSGLTKSTMLHTHTHTHISSSRILENGGIALVVVSRCTVCLNKLT